MATSPGPTDPSLVSVQPKHSAEEREELIGLAFHLTALEKLRARDLIAEDAYATVAAEARTRVATIEARGRSRAELDRARSLTKQFPKEALESADRARMSEPANPEPWILAIELATKLGDDPRAEQLCLEAGERFPGFPITRDVLAAEQVSREAKAARAAFEESLARVRAALARGDDATAISLCSSGLAERPDQFDMLVLLAFALQRQGANAQALTHYRRLVELEPANAAWGKWVIELERRLQRSGEMASLLKSESDAPEPAPGIPETAPTPPRLTWSSFAGEFVEDHWQKLILCLAVLLIVVSSNVGAYQVLGPKLWSPIGKCVLALVYTAMFAGFGVGLVRWGAERAGRIMLLTTLIVVPANFMLAGEMKLLTEPSASRLLVLAFDVSALFLLIRLLVSSLGWKEGGRALSAWLFVLCAFNLTSAPGVAWPWAWQFALFLAPAAVLLGTVAWLNTRVKRETFEAESEKVYFALGLFAFTFLTGVIRTGVFSLEPHPTLYALPVMAVALASVHTARRLGRFDPEPKRAAWLLFGGLVLSGVAFALALARPAGPIYSGNTLATALIGLILYALLLWWERHPSYLYLAFGALFLAYFGTYDFTKDLIQVVEQAASHALGYAKLPAPFRAINGLVFNSVLAMLSVYFRRRWNDPRLALHCHYLGLPLSIAACVFSAFEPKAALICMFGYAAFYTWAAWFFEAPKVIYLATAALTGATYFGLTLVPGAAISTEAVAASMLGLLYWTAAFVLKLRAGDPRYRLPMVHSAIAVSALGMLAAVSSVAIAPYDVALGAAAALIVAAGVFVLVNRDAPRAEFAYAAVIGGNLGYVFLVIHAGLRWSTDRNLARLAIATAAVGIVDTLIGGRIRRSREAGDDTPHLALFPKPLFETAFLQVGTALILCGLHPGRRAELLVTSDFATLAVALFLCSAALMLLVRVYPGKALVHIALACALGVWMCGFQAAMRGAAASPAEYAAVASTFALALLAAEEWTRAFVKTRKGIDPEFRSTVTPTFDLVSAAIPRFETAVVFGSVGLAALGLTNGPAVVFTTAAGALALLWSTRFRRSTLLVDAGLALAVAAACCLTAWRIGWVDAGYCLGWLALTVASIALAVSCAARVGLARGLSGLYIGPLVHMTSRLTWLAPMLAIVGRFGSAAAFPPSLGALVLNAVVLVLLTSTQRLPALTYRAILSVVLAAYVVVFSVGTASPDNAHVIGLVAVILALGLSSIGFACRWLWLEALESDGLYAVPLFSSSRLLTIAAVPLAYWSPLAMGLVGLSFLLFVKGIPSPRWIHATAAALGCALYFGVLRQSPPDRLVTAAIVVAYQLWLVGLFVRRYERALIRVLRLDDAEYDRPLFESAGVAAALSAALRFYECWNGQVPWLASAGLVLNLSAFCLLMHAAYSSMRWVHAATALASTSAVMATCRYDSSSPWLFAVGMGLANLWWIVAWLADRYQAVLPARLGARTEEIGKVVALWSRGTFAVTTLAVFAVVVEGTWRSITGAAASVEAARPWAWVAVFVAIALGGVYIATSWWRTLTAERLMGLMAATTLAVWWSGAPGSPLVASWGVSGAVYEPLATAVLALVVALVLIRLANPSALPAWLETNEPVEALCTRLEAYCIQMSVFLSLLAIAMTMGRVSLSTVGTLSIAAASTTILALGRRRVGAAYTAGAAWCGAGIVAAIEEANRLVVAVDSDRAIIVAIGTLAAVGVLWVLAGMSRRRPRAVEERDAVAFALEHVAFAASLFCGLCIVASASSLARPSELGAMAAVGVLWGLALFAIGMIARWGVDSFVYMAQTALVGSYLYYRWAFRLPASTDAPVLTLLGYLQLGLAEVMNRIGLDRFARPTRLFSLAMPALPIIFTLWRGGFDQANLIVLFTAATFYGLACYQMKWKELGYAAAVIYNAFLWLLWARLGWNMTDHTQFYLAPVGLSAVLFAEVNRHSLGRAAVNAIRGVGLSVIYLSLAAPIWRFESLGAWAALLLASLAGIFAGIGLRVQTFLWLGLAGFVLDVVYQLGKVGLEHTLAKWAIMLVLGILLILFVALNEKKRIVATMRDYYQLARQWE